MPSFETMRAEGQLGIEIVRQLNKNSGGMKLTRLITEVVLAHLNKQTSFHYETTEKLYVAIIKVLPKIKGVNILKYRPYPNEFYSVAEFVYLDFPEK
jgi:hypothetical protein